MDLDRWPEFRGVEVIGANFYTGGETVRHDPEVLARIIYERFMDRSGDARGRPRAVAAHGT
jgi:hypothetical protein